jgi:hypothetical protein
VAELRRGTCSKGLLANRASIMCKLLGAARLRRERYRIVTEQHLA